MNYTYTLPLLAPTAAQTLPDERLYDAACLTLATNANPTQINHPNTHLDFRQFAAKLQGHVRSITGR